MVYLKIDNIGINQANGKYIQIISGDDILLEEAIEKSINLQKKIFKCCIC